MKTKKFYLTVDLEEWYHLLYLRKYTNFKGQDFFVFRLNNFLTYLKNKKIYATFFVLAELAQKYPELIKKIHNNNHEICCHGLNHELISEKSEIQFVDELITAKKIIEKIIGEEIYGYRAPCFSLTNETLERLESIGFKYDSSYIKFSGHKLYNELNMSNFTRINSILLKHKNYDFFEFQIPTTKFLNLNIPISGGGYLRFIPFFIFKYFFVIELKKRNEYMLFLHPFELSNENFTIPFKVSFLDNLRFSYSRKTNIKRLDKLISISKKLNYEFVVMNPKL
jgi:polysaccharide deacetylase family protein (PEP-CTERM system associated)